MQFVTYSKFKMIISFKREWTEEWRLKIDLGIFVGASLFSREGKGEPDIGIFVGISTQYKVKGSIHGGYLHRN